MKRLRAHVRMKLAWIPRPVRRIIILMFGGTVLLIGAIMIVAPGPAFIVLPLGLLILGVEFAFARRWLKRLKSTANHVQQRVRNGIAGRKSQQCAEPSAPVKGL
jgi:membrane protein implicated in regulation of membrane protease activity